MKHIVANAGVPNETPEQSVMVSKEHPPWLSSGHPIDQELNDTGAVGASVAEIPEIYHLSGRIAAGLTIRRDAFVGRTKHVRLTVDIADRVNPHGLANVKLQSADLAKQTGTLQFRYHIRRRPFIQIQQRDRSSGDGAATEGEVCDIDAVVAHGLSQHADNARYILIGCIEHMAADRRVDIDSLDLDEAWLAIGEHVPAMDRSRTAVATVSFM